MPTLAEGIGGRKRLIGGPFGSNLIQADYQKSGIPVIRGANMSYNNRWIGGEFVFVSDRKVQNDLATNLAHPGDIIVTQRGTLGQVSMVPFDLPFEEYVVSQSQMAICVDPQVAEPLFVYYFLKSPVFSQYIDNAAIKVGVPHINLGLLRDTPVEWPQKSKQQSIASVLSALDDKIELNRWMNETLEASAQAIFKDWFVDFGPVRRKLEGATDPVALLGGLMPNATRAADIAGLFPGSFGDDGLPEGWDEKPFSDFVDIIGGGTPKTSEPTYWNGDFPWFSVVDTPSGSDTFVFRTEKTITPRGLSGSSARLISPGTTIITARGTVGNLAIAGREMTFNQSCYALRSLKDLHPFFTYLAAKQVVERLKSMAHGSVFSTITRQTFENVNLPTSSIEIRDAFEKLSAPLLERISASVQENRTLAETRDYLLPKLMSGEVRVRDAQEAVS
ncbi:MAG: restriction endonuclease subunit S [Mesorhizobium sp.]|nr:MAG: restriction endonuclease subunit S [Mesorhizobium sp.]